MKEIREVPRNSVKYLRDKQTPALVPLIEVADAEYDRNMITIFGSSPGIKAIAFPGTVRKTRRQLFC